MVIKRKALIIAAAIDVALFIIAAPLGDSHHGIGEHNHAVADLGNVVFGAFLIGVVVLIVLIVVALIQLALRSRHVAGNGARE
jgi:NADH:ubiquinone oxidoreductase subunit 6 (subunit J)